MNNRVVRTAIFRKTVTVNSVGSGGTAFTFNNVPSGLWTVVSSSVARASGANTTALGLMFGTDNGASAGQPQGGVAVQAWPSSGRLAWTNTDEAWLVPGTTTGTAQAWVTANGATGDVVEIEIVAELRESGEPTASWTEYT